MTSQLQPSLTVVMPLHAAQPWLPVITENIRNCPTDCRILISDATLADTSMEELRKIHGGDRRIVFRNKLETPGWREHINVLLPEIHTDYVSIMAQDDSIGPGYYEKLLAAHVRFPGCAVTCGVIEAHGLPESEAPVLFDRLPFTTGVLAPWLEAVIIESGWNLGIAFRGVVRREFALPIFPTDQDRFADVIWVFGLLLHGWLKEVPDAIYVKRYHDSNTHSSWLRLSREERYSCILVELRRHFAQQPNLFRLAIHHVNHFFPGITHQWS